MRFEQRLSWPHYASERLGEGVRDLITIEPEKSGSFFLPKRGPLSESASTKHQVKSSREVPKLKHQTSRTRTSAGATGARASF
jgi:hypothetical protein